MPYAVLALAAVLAFLVVLALVLARLNPGAFKEFLSSLLGGKATSYPYKKREYLLTSAENSFFQVLRKVAGHEYELFAKVRLSDLLYLPKGTPNAQAHRNRIFQKHMDFVLCDPVKVSPVLAIELDDRSHEQNHRKKRDAFVENALEAAGLPLLRIQAATGYSPRELAEAMRERIAR